MMCHFLQKRDVYMISVLPVEFYTPYPPIYTKHENNKHNSEKGSPHSY